MQLVKAALPVTVALAVVSAVTAVLWYSKLATYGPDHPVFFYLLPIALVAILYGSYPALLGAFAAAAFAPTIFSTTRSTASTSPPASNRANSPVSRF